MIQENPELYHIVSLLFLALRKPFHCLRLVHALIMESNEIQLRVESNATIHEKRNGRNPDKRSSDREEATGLNVFVECFMSYTR